MFAAYAYPPNELGYCGPPEPPARSAGPAEMNTYAAAFDGAWPYLTELAVTAGRSDPLDPDVVRSYWVGGPLLDRVDGDRLLDRLRHALAGQPTGLLAEVSGADALAHHSFHVFVVYPWVRFLSAEMPPTAPPLRILQDCRIRWGVVESVDDRTVVMTSRRLCLAGGMLALGPPGAETVRWRAADGTALIARPSPGETVAAHGNWVCGRLDDEQRADLDAATASTLEVVNRLRAEMCQVR